MSGPRSLIQREAPRQPDRLPLPARMQPAVSVGLERNTDEALRGVKLLAGSSRGDGSGRHPYYWAAFIVAGRGGDGAIRSAFAP
jgi:hypothetical protein